MLLADDKTTSGLRPRIGSIWGCLLSPSYFRELLHSLRTKVLSTYADAIQVAMTTEFTQTIWRKNGKA
jgi:hypothetical protein